MDNKKFRNGIFFLLTAFLILQLSGISLAYSDTSDLFFDDPFYQDDFDSLQDLFFDGSEPVVLEDQTEFLTETEISGLEDPEAILPDTENADPILPGLEDAEPIISNPEDAEEPDNLEDFTGDALISDQLIFETEISEPEMAGTEIGETETVETEMPEILMLASDSSEQEIVYGMPTMYAHLGDPDYLATPQYETDSDFYKVYGTNKSYQWQYSKDGGLTWYDDPDGTTEGYTITVTPDLYHCMFRCLVSNDKGDSVYSRTFWVEIWPKFITQPLSHPRIDETEYGKIIPFTVEATGIGVTLQWQYSTDNGATWKNSVVKNKTTYPAIASPEHFGFMYRCVATDVYGNSVKSYMVELGTYMAVKILSPTKAVRSYAGLGETARFEVKAIGRTPLSYLWQYSKDSGATLNNSTVNTDTYEVTVHKVHDGFRYRCIVNDKTGRLRNSKTSPVMTLSVAPKITIQPVSMTTTVGGSASFEARAIGIGPLTYQWQYSTNGGTTWRNSGTRKPVYTNGNVGEIHDQFQYRCLITSANGTSVLTDVATLTVLP